MELQLDHSKPTLNFINGRITNMPQCMSIDIERMRVSLVREISLRPEGRIQL